MIWPVVTYAPTAATKPNIAAQPLKRSASGVMIKNLKICILNIVTEIMKLCKVFFVFLLIFNFLVKIMSYFYSNVAEMCQIVFSVQ